MTRHFHLVYRAIYLLQVVVLLATPLWFRGGVGALELTNRSAVLSASTPSAVASHTFNVTFGSTSSVGSIRFEYCTNSPILTDSCNAPAGLSLSSASLGSQSGNIGFSIDTGNSTATTLILTRPSLPAVAVASQYRFDNITNPSTAKETSFVRLATYATTDASGPATDQGSVAFATNDIFSVGAYIAPYLSFCVGITVEQNCASTNGFITDVGELSSTKAKAATTQFAVSTNDAAGCFVYTLGSTLLSGNHIIPPLSSPTASAPGTSQFGINLRQNTDPAFGSEPSGGTTAPTGNYDQTNRYAYEPGAAVASSPIPTEFTRMTVTYLINVSKSQEPGRYGTTITYLATAQF